MSSFEKNVIQRECINTESVTILIIELSLTLGESQLDYKQHACFIACQWQRSNTKNTKNLKFCQNGFCHSILIQLSRENQCKCLVSVVVNTEFTTNKPCSQQLVVDTNARCLIFTIEIQKLIISTHVLISRNGLPNFYNAGKNRYSQFEVDMKLT